MTDVLTWYMAGTTNLTAMVPKHREVSPPLHGRACLGLTMNPQDKLFMTVAALASVEAGINTTDVRRPAR